jgi:regulator of RNase E activity RraA
MKVSPGDIIHGDKHGVLVVPREALAGLPSAVDKVATSERRIIDLCQSPEFSLDKLGSLFARLMGKGEYGGDEK